MLACELANDEPEADDNGHKFENVNVNWVPFDGLFEEIVNVMPVEDRQ